MKTTFNLKGRNIIKKIYSVIVFVFFLIPLVSCLNKTVKVDFNSMGGSIVNPVTLDKGGKIAIPQVENEGYALEGWYTSLDKGETFNKRWSFDEDTVDKNLTLYAKWEMKTGPEKYVLATDSDFEGDKDGEFVYIGDADYVIIPEYINGIKITKTSNYSSLPLIYLFSMRKDIKGVIFEKPENVVDFTLLFSENTSSHIELDYLDTSNVVNMSFMFSKSHATTLDLSNFDTSKVTDMKFMFWESNVATLDLSNFDTSNVEDMQGMFGKTQLTALDLSNFNTSKVTDMIGMFWGLQALTLDLSGFDTSNVTKMRFMFTDSKVVSLDLSSFDTSKVIDMGYMFKNSDVVTLDLSSFDLSKVKDMGFFLEDADLLEVGYARTEEEKDILNTHKDVFTVK